MNEYTTRNGATYGDAYLSGADPLAASLWADLQLAIAGWKARGEEIERLVAANHSMADLSSWQLYAEAFEAYCDVKRDKLPTRAEFGL